MLRNLIVVGAAVGVSAAIPMLYEANPELFHNALKPAATSQASRPVAQPAVAPSAPQPEAEILLGRKVRISADGRGHFSAEFKLNGRRLDAMIDTGATVVAINQSTARRIGIHLTPVDFVHEVNTANGRARAAAAMIGRLQIGRIYLENVEAVVLEDRALKGTLIGMSFLRRLDRYQVEDGALLLEQ